MSEGHNVESICIAEIIEAGEGATQLEKILSLESSLREFPQLELPLTHVFAFGLYAREITIPKGTIMTGRIHKNVDLNIVYYGDMDVMTEHGMKRVQGPCMFKGRANTKQIGYAYEQTRWVTVHATELTDLREIEEALFADEGKPLLHDFTTGRVVNHDLVAISQVDYRSLVKELGMTEEVATAISAPVDDLELLDLASLGLRVAPSCIDGLGLFALRSFESGEMISAAITTEGRRTQLGRYVNHSPINNAVLTSEGTLVAIRRIESEEITRDYRDAKGGA